MGQFGLCMVQSVLGQLALFLRALLFGQIKHESNTFISPFFEEGSAEQYGHPAAVFPEILFLEGLEPPRLLYLCHGTFVAVAPFWRSQVSPADATRNKIFTVVSHHVKKRFIGLNNLTFKVPNTDPNNVRVDQTSDPGFQPLGQLTYLCFRLFARGDLQFEVLNGFQSLICQGGELPQGTHDSLIFRVELATITVRDRPYRPD